LDSLILSVIYLNSMSTTSCYCLCPGVSLCNNCWLPVNCIVTGHLTCTCTYDLPNDPAYEIQGSSTSIPSIRMSPVLDLERTGSSTSLKTTTILSQISTIRSSLPSPQWSSPQSPTKRMNPNEKRLRGASKLTPASFGVSETYKSTFNTAAQKYRCVCPGTLSKASGWRRLTPLEYDLLEDASSQSVSNEMVCVRCGWLARVDSEKPNSQNQLGPIGL